MLFQTIEFLQVIADIIGAILIFLKPVVTPIGVWMTNWITTTIDFLQQNLSSDLTIFIVICVILVVSGIIINIIWPGDIKGTIFSKGKIEDLEDKIDKEEEDIVDSVRRCKDCGNPIGDADVCPLCGARN
ncbi:MAG: hypothetical protein CEE43_09485 [Promethearchaeota archaeon Loki_b32]|nr:MAG: hypothetical protein CEE43_09485 [Candidatus Lokiarchaeota archaeon Loki_b32]